MAGTDKVKRIAPTELASLLDEARAQRWQELALVGADIGLPHRVEDWAESLKTAKQVYLLTAFTEGLATKLQLLPDLTSLLLWGNQFGDEGAKAIAASLSGLTSLDLRDNNIGAEGAMAIAASLSRLTALNLRGNSIGDEGARAIAASLSGLTSLDLGSNNVGAKGVRAIAASLSKLTALNLRGSNIGDVSAGAIAASLSGLVSLDLRRNNIGAEGARAIASLSGLTSLDLRSNNIGAEGAKAIAASLCDLTSLDLGYNDTCDEGAGAIAASLSGLVSLDLRDNRIGAEGAKAIAGSLTDLTSLNLRNNRIGDQGAKDIASLSGLTSLDLGYSLVGAEGTKAIASLYGLISLDLRGNHFGADGARNIGSLSGLTSLDLGYCTIGDEGAKAIASLPRLTSLDLGGCGIGAEGARAIASLSNLTSLDAGYNNIGDEGARAIAASLSRISSLDLRDNNIGAEGARAITASLSSLTSLDLRGNNIGAEGARAIAASLFGLTSLVLGGNSIGDDGVSALAASLSVLTSLDLGNNNIGAEGARAIAASLPGRLTSLDLGGNKIGAEGAKALLGAWSSQQKSGQLRRLDLRNNGNLGDLLPREVLETSDGQAILAAYRSFVLAREKQTLRPLNEVKLLAVGNEAVGKTSLLRYLIQGRPRDPNETKTPGIVQHQKIEIREWSPHHCQVQLNVWDFGGQEMMRGTHRFFLTERSLYLLVLEDRRQDDRSIYDWMKTIRNRGGASPVMVVINKSDTGKQDLRLDENGLRESYPNIVAFLRTSCDPGDWAKDSIEKLRGTIVETIIGNEHLKHVQDPIPANWLRIKNLVRELADQRSVLSHAEFIALCKDPGGGTDPVVEESEQRALLRLLHELGAIVAHGLERDAPAARREINLLDPNWLTGAIYRIIDKARSVDQEGEFFRHQLVDWFDPGPYPPERYEFILDMMQDQDIGLCFRLPTREERYLLPEALPASRRFYGKWPEDSLRFRYTYNYLPPGLIPRFIVQSHRNLTPEKSRWRTGVVLSVQDCETLVLADVDRRRVDIQVAGSPALRRAALSVILNDLEAVHALNPEAEPAALVPLPDRADVHVRYEHLLMLEQRMGSSHLFIPDGADRPYTVGELLDGVRRDYSKQPARIDSSAQDTKSHVVILIHGIRTRALWQNELRKTLEKYGFVVEPTNYGFFDTLRFLFPWQLFAGAVVADITRQLRHARVEGADHSIIAHSFGTFVAARILRDHTDLVFNRIIFCGSVVPRKFPFEDHRKRFKAPLLNEVGTRDFWPVMAEVVTFGYGSAGTYGFRRPPVRDRWHNGKAHGDFLNQEFCRKYWVPYLSNGTIVEDDEKAERPPWWLSTVSTLQIRYVFLIAVAALIWLM